MTKAIKHIVEIHIQNIQGIHVFDRKLPHQEGQGGPRGLNKISAIASIRRNKNVTTSGTSYPLQPSSNLQSSNGSYLYHANWNHSDAKDTSSRIALQTNLHPLPKQQQQKKNKNIMYLFDQQQQVNTNKFEPKRFDVVIGLKRGNEFVVLATSLIHIDKEMANEEMTLPLIPIMATTSRNKSRTKGDHPHDDLTTAFADDENRYFSLDAGAVLHCSVSVSCHDTWHKKLHMERMMSQKMSLFYDEDDTTVPKMNEKKEVLLQTNNPATNGDVTEESRDDICDDDRTLSRRAHEEADHRRMRYDDERRFIGRSSTKHVRNESFSGRRWENFDNNLDRDDEEENLDDLYNEDVLSFLVNAMKCNAAKDDDDIARELTKMNRKDNQFSLSDSNGWRCGAISHSLQQSYSDYSESYSAESNEYSAFTDLE